MRESDLGSPKQGRLIKHFVHGTTARCATSLVLVNFNTSAYYFHRLREFITYNLEQEAERHCQTKPALTDTHWNYRIFRWKLKTHFVILEHLLKSSLSPWWCASGFHFHYVMSKIYSINGGLMFVTKQSGFGGTDSARCLPAKPLRDGTPPSEPLKLEMASWWSLREDQWTDTLSLVCCWSWGWSSRSLCIKEAWSQGSHSFPEENHETVRQTKRNCHWQIAFL